MAETKYIAIQNPKENLPIVLRFYCKNYLQKQWQYREGAEVNHLFFCTKGKGKIEFSKQTLTVNEGEFWFFKRGVPITYYPLTEEFVVDYICFDGQAADLLMDFYKIPNVLIFKSEILQIRFKEIFEHIKNNYQDRASSAIYSALVEMGNVCTESETNDWFYIALKFINENYYKDISANDIATFAKVSQSALFKRFKKEKGISPVTYINNVRIDVAKQYLLNVPNLSIEEISKNVGFESRCYFTKCFKNSCGVTPMQFKKERP